MKVASLPAVHFIDPFLLAPGNPILVNLIGVGATGSQVIEELARINHILLATGKPGLHVRAFDGDVVTEPNLGKQHFADAELGMNKAEARIMSINRGFGTAWEAHGYAYGEQSLYLMKEKRHANITISCVDDVPTRFAIAGMLKDTGTTRNDRVDRPLYWMDFGNGRYTGQVMLSTVQPVSQPKSKRFATVAYLPFITDEYRWLLEREATKKDQPSCSTADALAKQDLFINSSLAVLGCDLLLKLLNNAMTKYRGLFFNLTEYHTQPVKVA